MNIKRLVQSNWEDWKNIRLQALRNEPCSFGGSYEEAVNYSTEYWQESIKKNDIFGAFIQNNIIGIVGFYAETSLKIKHKGFVFAMYIAPQHRKCGVASQLLQAAIDHASVIVSQLHLSCATINIKALKLYKKYGFEIYGQEPGALKVDDKFIDEYLMVLNFRRDQI